MKLIQPRAECHGRISLPHNLRCTLECTAHLKLLHRFISSSAFHLYNHEDLVFSIIVMKKGFHATLGFTTIIVLCLYLTFKGNFQHFEVPSLAGIYPDRKHIFANLPQPANDSTALFQPPLYTRGRYIIDSNGDRFKLASINWYGASDELFIPGGLDVQHRQTIGMTIRHLGFNSVRLPYADEMVRKNPSIPPELLSANPDLAGSTALDVFHAVVESLTDAGLAVIVNNHITQSRWCCDGNLCDTSWSNAYLGPLCRVRQTEDDWIENWETIMRPHSHNPFVIGADLRNEVRSPWGRLFWNSWATAAEKAAEKLLDIQPDWLIFVEGVSSANDISGARSRPVELTIPHRLVYSAHVYGWSGWGQLDPYSNRRYESFAEDMQRNWAYLLEEEIAPVWVGEFGAPDHPNKGDLHYWTNLIRYLEEVDADFGYWAINPRKPKGNEVESYSLVEDDWITPKYDYRIHDLTRLVARPNRTQAEERHDQL
jgi:endoglucanase